jgi:phage/conjugal plasmid C-4 type zinc finger TraR family protein
MSYASIDGLETEAQLAHIEDSLTLNRLNRIINSNVTGLCEECDEPIPAPRLKAVPNAACCIQCQSERDSNFVSRFTHKNPYVP